MSKRKMYFVDTSVLLYDIEAIHAFVGNTVCLSMQVLDEIDKFKDKKGILGENARYVNRFLDSLRGEGRSLSRGVHHEEKDIIYRVIVNKHKREDYPDVLDTSVPDNRIIMDALEMKRSALDVKVVVVTKDINMRVKCDSLGLRAEDYWRDHLKTSQLQDDNCVWDGVTQLEVDHETIQQLFSSDECCVELPSALPPNSLVVMRCGQQSGLAVVDGSGEVARKMLSGQHQYGISPYDKEQSFALQMLGSQAIPMLTITGAPGSGKTFLTLLAGIEQVISGVYDRIVITRSIQPVGKEMGFLPGDVDDKMAPWLGPIFDNFRQAYKDTTYFESMIQKGQIDIAPLSFIRGRSFPRSYIIVDEAQNATIHELKTVITRAGEASKIILMGDIEQIDTPYIDRYSNGLSVVIDRFRNSSLAAHIHLNKGRRSELANEANKLL